MVGNVREDTSQIFKVLNLSNSSSYAAILAIQTFVFVVFVIIITLNYGAVIMYQVDIPISQLTQFLLQNNQANKNISTEERSKKLLPPDSPLKQKVKLNKMFREKFRTNKQQPLEVNTFGIAQSFEMVVTAEVSPNISAVDVLKKSTFSKNREYLQKTKKLNTQQKYSIIVENKDSVLEKKLQADSFYGKSIIPQEKSDIFYTLGQSINSVNKELQSANGNGTPPLILNTNNQSFKNKTEEKWENTEQFEKSKGDTLMNSNNGLYTSVPSKKSTSTVSVGKSQIYEKKINIEIDIEPMFYEMKIIKDTFHQLGNVIAYKKNDVIHSKSNTLDNKEIKCQAEVSNFILHYSFASKMFKQLKNNYGVSISRINLGYFCQISNDFSEALFHYEAAIYHSILELGLQSWQEFLETFNQGQLNQIILSARNSTQELIIVCISLMLQIHTIKEIILERTDMHVNRKIRYNFLKNGQKKKWLKKALELHSILNKILKQYHEVQSQIELSSLYFIDLEIIEILIELDFYEKAKDSLEYLEIKFQNTKYVFSVDQFMIFEQYSPTDHYENQDQNETNNIKVMFQMIESTIYYLKGLVFLFNKSFYYACENFENCLQGSFFLSFNLQKKCLVNIQQILYANNLNTRTLQLAQSFLNYKNIEKVYDIAIIVDASLGVTFNEQNEIAQSILSMYSQFIQKEDRTTFIAYSEKDTRIIQPLLTIDKFKQWQFCVDSIPIISQQMLQKQQVQTMNKLDESSLYSINVKKSSFNKISSHINNFNNNNNTNYERISEEVFLPINKESIVNQKKFVKLQQKNNQRLRLGVKNIRKTLFFVFSNESSKESEMNIQGVIQKLSIQFSQRPQILQYKKQLCGDGDLNVVMRSIQNEEMFINIGDLKHLKYFIHYNNRSDNSKYYLTNLILTQSNI